MDYFIKRILSVKPHNNNSNDNYQYYYMAERNSAR